MLRDLNDLLAAHARGEDTTEQFRDFMEQHGDFFPEQPETVDELVDALAARAAAAQRMLASMTPEQRAELAEPRCRRSAPRVSWTSSRRSTTPCGPCGPGRTGTARSSSAASRGWGLGDGTGVLQDIAELDSLTDQLAQAHPGARMDDVDLDALARQVGDEAAVEARALTELEKALRDSGYLTRAADGTLRLSPRAMRELGRSLLRDVAGRLSARQGARDVRAGRGRRAERGDPRLGVRRHRALGRHPHDDQRADADGRGRRHPRGATASGSTSATSR